MYYYSSLCIVRVRPTFSLSQFRCSEEVVDTGLAQSHHYREECYNKDTCDMKNDVVEDSRVLRYLQQIVENTNSAI